MTPRYRRIDRSLREPQWGIRLVTLFIVIVGVVLIVLAFPRSESRRLRTMERLAVGDSVGRVAELLGHPAVTCPTGSLVHLRDQFPPGWPTAARERAVEHLQRATTERWIYPLDARSGAACDAPAAEATEIGVDSDRRVLWYVPVAGKQPVHLPLDLTPATVTEEAAEPDA